MAGLNDDFDKETDLHAAFDAEPVALPPETNKGSPLARALEQQTGDVVTVTDPQEGNLGQFTRDGRRFMSSEDMARNLEANANLGTQKALRSFLSGGGVMMDELLGAQAVGQSTADTIRKALSGNYEATNPVTAYRNARDAARRETKQATEDVSPRVFGVPVLPALGATVATLPAGGAGGMGAIFRAGAGAGGVLGVGDSEADLTRGNIGGFAGDVGMQSLLGGTGSVVGSAAARIPGAIASKVATSLSNSAPINALKALGLRAGISNALKQLGYETPEAAKYLGQFALDKGLIESGGAADDVFAATQKALQQTGQELDPIYARAQAATGGVDPEEAAWKATFSTIGNGLDAESQAQTKSAAEAVKRILQQGKTDNSFPAMRQLKTALQRGTDYRTETPLSAELKRKAVSGLRQSMEEQVSRALSPTEAARLGQLNADYGSLKDISKLALDEAQRGFGRVSPVRAGIADAISGGATFGPGGAVGSVGKSAARQFIAPSRMAVWQNALAPEAADLAQGLGALRPVGAAAGAQLRDDDEAISAFLYGG